jgi:membrane fusion protein (multidrug efflux system)
MENAGIGQTENEPRARSRRGKNLYLAAGMVLVLAVLAVGLGPRVFYALSHESTDDAYVDGKIVTVSAEVTGNVAKVYVEDNQPVKEGGLLVEIEDRHYRLTAEEKEARWKRLIAEETEIRLSVEEKTRALERANAELEAAHAEEQLSSKERERYRRLLEEQSVSRSRYDDAEAKWQVAAARTKAARAALAEYALAVDNLKAGLVIQRGKIREALASLDLARLSLHKTEVRAPVTGRVARKNVEVGKYVNAGQPLLSIVDGSDIWIVANFKETQIEKMKVGDPVDIRVDAYPNRVFKGRVDSFQPGTGAVFSLLPPENSTGNFVKVVQRVPVKIVLDSPGNPGSILWPGMSVVPSVATEKTAAPALDRGNTALGR